MSLAEQLAASWNLQLTEQLPGGHCSEVWAGLQRDRRIVLKVPLPHSDEVATAPTLQAFSTVGGVQLLDFDPVSGATLLEHILPGTPLPAMPEDEAIAICAQCIRQLRQAPITSAPALTNWLDRIQPDGRPFINAAAAIKTELLQTSQPCVLLHGDLHHSNILRGPNGWIVIDPKGLIGDRSYEITPFMRNPLEDNLTAERQYHRLMSFSELLGDPVDRLWGWSFCEAVLDVIWSEEDGTDTKRSWQRAETLWSLRHHFNR